MSAQCSPNTFSYQIKAGDTLYRLAAANQTTVPAIVSANPGALLIGQKICVPD